MKSATSPGFQSTSFPNAVGLMFAWLAAPAVENVSLFRSGPSRRRSRVRQ